MKKIAYISLGFLALALGAIGAVVPMLPTVPFLLLCAICFGKSSEKLEQWFKQTNLYKKNLESYVEHRGMSRKTKLYTVSIITALFAVGFYFMERVPVARGILLIIWGLHIYYFMCRVKTIIPSKTLNQ